VLSKVLHKLRDRIPVELAAHLGSQLPLLVRGVYYDQFQPARQPTACRSYDEFCSEVAEWLRDNPAGGPAAGRPHRPHGALAARPGGPDLQGEACPARDIRDAWRSAAEFVAPPPAQGQVRRYAANGTAYNGQARPF
jgi:hypothetical protein